MHDVRGVTSGRVREGGDPPAQLGGMKEPQKLTLFELKNCAKKYKWQEKVTKAVGRWMLGIQTEYC